MDRINSRIILLAIGLFLTCNEDQQLSVLDCVYVLMGG